MPRNPLALLISFAYVFAAIGIAEALRKWRGYPIDFTRKFIHIAVGMWSYGTVLLFQSRTFAIIPPAAFIAINALSYWRGTFKAMEAEEKENLGTVYFPISFAVLLWLLWDRPYLLVASLMPMTWGDAMAAIIGRPFGRRIYTILGSTRSLEGSTAMFGFAWVATFVALLLLAPISLGLAAMVALVTAIGATIAEAVSPWGTDNLTVPAVSTLILVLMLP